jgi:hypothetical protein
MPHIIGGNFQIIQGNEIVAKAAILNPLDVPQQSMQGHEKPSQDAEESMVLKLKNRNYISLRILNDSKTLLAI